MHKDEVHKILENPDLRYLQHREEIFEQFVDRIVNLIGYHSSQVMHGDLRDLFREWDQKKEVVIQELSDRQKLKDRGA